MARMPGAKWLGEHSPRRLMSRYDIVCVHTIVGYAPAHAAHFSVKLDGTILQSRDTRYRSAANLEGNHRIIAIENEDAAKDIPLTPEQVVSNARILAWVHKTHGTPLQLAPNSRSTSRGLGYHRQGIDGNFGGYAYPGRVSGGEHWSEAFGKVCPRDKRIAQVPEILRRAKLIANPPVEMVTSDVRFVLANVRSNPLMSPAQAKEDYVIAFAGARARKAQSVYINEYHPTYASVLASAAKTYGYKVRAINAASGLAVATKATGWTLDGIAFSLLAGGIKGISPNRGVLRVGEKTPAGTRIVWDDIMLPRGWNNPQYSGYAKTSAMARTIFEKLKPIIVSQTGTLKSVAVLAGDVNQGSAVDWERHLGLKPAATVVRTGGTAVDKMMQAAVFVPAGATAKMVDKIDLGEGEENTDHGILFCHVQVTRPR
ncbi:MAG TPA: N-acetylmuramoyl-L-alanine amidase [Aeromicrobium sp.]|nr:N-acetylmuramoyl-L-alanine amidase [Aeromicrobium sp.]HKY59220.1 N-acetylmuramoyl-L-alanine amidase [Aeromicrobium sp.]